MMAARIAIVGAESNTGLPSRPKNRLDDTLVRFELRRSGCEAALRAASISIV